MFQTVRKEIVTHIKKLEAVDSEKRIEERINKFCDMGVVVEPKVKASRKSVAAKAK